MHTLEDIDLATKLYAGSRGRLCEHVNKLNAIIEAAKRQHLHHIKRAVAAAAEDRARLEALIAYAPELFKKPRTVVFHGIKLGYQKGKGGIGIENPDQTVKLIRKHFPDQADTLIQTKETPAKGALVQLSVAELKRLGCTVIETGDQILIKAVDSEVDKLVAKLLDEASEEVEQ